MAEVNGLPPSSVATVQWNQACRVRTNTCPVAYREKACSNGILLRAARPTFGKGRQHKPQGLAVVGGGPLQDRPLVADARI